MVNLGEYDVSVMSPLKKAICDRVTEMTEDITYPKESTIYVGIDSAFVFFVSLLKIALIFIMSGRV